MKNRDRLTPLERSWVLYDVGNSAIFFKNLTSAAGVADHDSTAYWSYTAAFCTLVVAFLGPTLGALADTKGFKKPLFTAMLALGVVGCLALPMPLGWMGFLVLFILAKVGFSGSLVFYDAMLSDVTEDSRMDMVSSKGYAWGYLGSCLPFVLCLALILTAEQTGLGTATTTGIAFLITALWWIGCSLPAEKLPAGPLCSPGPWCGKGKSPPSGAHPAGHPQGKKGLLVPAGLLFLY